jgi:hypothetical protein
MNTDSSHPQQPKIKTTKNQKTRKTRKTTHFSRQEANNTVITALMKEFDRNLQPGTLEKLLVIENLKFFVFFGFSFFSSPFAERPSPLFLFLLASSP